MQKKNLKIEDLIKLTEEQRKLGQSKKKNLCVFKN